MNLLQKVKKAFGTSDKTKKKKTSYKEKLKNRVIHNKMFLRFVTIARAAKNLILNIPIDFVFVFFASFLLTHSYELWERLLFSIGLSYIAYKAKELFMLYLTVAYRGSMK